MKISEITEKEVSEYLRLDPDEIQESVLHAAMAVAKQYIMDYTGLTEEEMETKDSLYIAFMVICQDVYDNRSMYIDQAGKSKDNVNKVVDAVLSMYCVNLL